jgi:hypothetical protein
VQPWVDALLLSVCCRQGLRRAFDLLGASGVNHAGLDLRQGFREATLLAELARLPEAPCLRTLSLALPYRLVRAGGPGDAGHPCRRPAFGEAFLRQLLAGLPLTRRLTHLASDPAWSPEQAALIRALGVTPAHAATELWMYDLPPAALKARDHVRTAAPAGRPVLRPQER